MNSYSQISVDHIDYDYLRRSVVIDMKVIIGK
jgi:hypothetical protein